MCLGLAFTFLFFSARSQDTLHLNYHFTQILPHDSTQAKIDKWVKSLNGQHVDIKVIAYFNRSEFKKVSQQRCDELFLVLNRKARSLITIEFIGTKAGKDYQRTMVDIIYSYTGAAEKAAAAAIAEKEKQKAEEKLAEEQKAAEKLAKKEQERIEKEARQKEEQAKDEKEKEEKASKAKEEKPAAADKEDKKKKESAEKNEEKESKKEKKDEAKSEKKKDKKEGTDDKKQENPK
jgi:hypothetical protein